MRVPAAQRLMQSEVDDGGRATASDAALAAAGDAPPRNRRRLAICAALLLAAGAATVLLASGSSSPRLAANAGSAAGAATVERRNLVATDTESGTLSYSHPQTVYDRLGGTITWLPTVGRLIRRGQPLFEVDNRPVILLYGAKPAYRDLDSSDRSGPDVGELNANLVALGYDDGRIVVDESWQAATTDGVKELQKALGERQTGRIVLGQVTFLPGEQLVNAVAGAVGSPASYDQPDGARAEYVDLASPGQMTSAATTRTTTASESTTTTTQGALTVTQTVTVTASSTPASERESSAGGGKSRGGRGGDSSGSGSAGGGKGSQASGGKSGGDSAGSGASGSTAAPGGTAILHTSSTRLVARVDMPASSQSEAVVGSHVTVEMPNGSVVGGTIASVSPIASSGAGSGAGRGGAPGGAGGNSEGGESGSTATVPVTVALDGHLRGAGLDQAPVSVNFAQARARNVLSVPVTALVATTGGGYALQEAAAPHRLLPVSTGLFAAGYVEISGAGIREGLRVTDSQG
jgi:Putative peptidoglycan binding domain